MGQSFSINHLGTMKIMDQHGVLAVIEKVGLFNTYNELENYNLRNGIFNKPTVSKNTTEEKKPEIKKIDEPKKGLIFVKKEPELNKQRKKKPKKRWSWKKAH